MTEQEAHDHLSSDYAESGDINFTLQHVIDAYAAQRATAQTKDISVFFALAGLCLRVEKRLSGREVQHVHQLLTRRKQIWPHIELPEQRGAVTATDVMGKPIGPERDSAVDTWCESVWTAFQASHGTIRREMRKRGIDV
jgi:hypothetical protein